jgi:hypothetical protein
MMVNLVLAPSTVTGGGEASKMAIAVIGTADDP